MAGRYGAISRPRAYSGRLDLQHFAHNKVSADSVVPHCEGTCRHVPSQWLHKPVNRASSQVTGSAHGVGSHNVIQPGAWRLASSM
jgi:hypothetical protein